jgi:putative acetyltransferase
MALEFFTDQLDRADVQALLDAHFGAMRAISPPEACHVLPADGLRDPGVIFWAARDRGQLAGIGALKLLGDGHGELKSMSVAASSLGKGVGRAILEQIIGNARQRGLARLSLETGGTADFDAALGLYRSAGFVPCGPFADYAPTPFTRFLTLKL